MKKIILLVIAFISFVGCDMLYNKMADEHYKKHLGVPLYDDGLRFSSLEEIRIHIIENIVYEKGGEGFFPPEQTIKNGKGNCKAMAILFLNYAYFSFGITGRLCYIEARMIEDGGEANHAIIKIGADYFSPITFEKYDSVGYSYGFWEVFN